MNFSIVRAAAFRDTLNRHYSTQLFAAHICDTGYITDGHALANNYPYLITECKNEIGNSGADPYLQGGLYYYEFMRKLSLDAPASTLPCLHIFYFGESIK